MSESDSSCLFEYTTHQIPGDTGSSDESDICILNPRKKMKIEDLQLKARKRAEDAKLKVLQRQTATILSLHASGFQNDMIELVVGNFMGG